MCWCRPEIRTPVCDRAGCHPPPGWKSLEDSLDRGLKAAAVMPKWEHRVEKGCTPEQLTALGEEGWELVGMHQPEGEEIVGVHTMAFPIAGPSQMPIFARAAVRYTFKRPKVEA